MNLEEWNNSSVKKKAEYKAAVSWNIKRQREIIVGDLVRLAPWCKNKFRLGHVTDVAWWDSRKIAIQFLDSAGLKNIPSFAAGGQHGNLEIISPLEDTHG